MELSNQPSSHGIIIQSPIEIPNTIPLPLLASKVAIEKDVDGLHPGNFALISSRILAPRFYPCTPLGIVHLLRHYGLSNLSGARVCVIGRSEIVGLPMAAMLTRLHATVTLCHSATKDINQITKQSDIVVAAVGQANFIQKDWIRPESIVIDVGINRWIDPWGKTKIVGDVAPDVAQVASAITPVPGGVGPMTVAMLVSNVFSAAISQSFPSNKDHAELLAGLTI